MHRIIAVALIVSIVGFRVPQASGQILGGKDAPIVYGHHHLNATNIDEHKKFWVDTLGGTAIKAGTFDVVVFPNVLIFLNARTPSGPTKGSSLNHIGFSVPNLRQVVDKIKANGYVMVTAEEAPAGVTVKDDIGLTLVGRRLFNVIDHQHVDRPFRRLELESKLLLQRGKNRRLGRIGRGNVIVPRLSALLGLERQRQVPVAGKPCPIEHHASRDRA
jgi:hypothetical protein